jgi:hypothetical protein
VVPDSFDGYFTAAASAAGALIGLLFVAISMRPDAVLGANPSSHARALASSSFTGLGPPHGGVRCATSRGHRPYRAPAQDNAGHRHRMGHDRIVCRGVDARVELDAGNRLGEAGRR